MSFIISGIKDAIYLLISFDPYIYGIIFFTLKITIISLFVASLTGIPAGLLIFSSSFKLKREVKILFNSLLSLPTVIIGLFLYFLFSRNGPFGFFELLFTPSIIIIGEIMLSCPIIVALTVSSAENLDKRILETTKMLGASKIDTIKILFNEGKISFMIVIMTAFGRILTELGCALMVGGNIKEYTRTLTTAIILETQRGEFEKSMALGIILLLISLSVNILVNLGFRR